MSEKLMDGWLALELKAVKEEIERWPEGLRQSFQTLPRPAGRAALSREEGR